MLSVDPFKTAQDAVDWIKIAASGALALLTLLIMKVRLERVNLKGQ